MRVPNDMMHHRWPRVTKSLMPKHKGIWIIGLLVHYNINGYVIYNPQGKAKSFSNGCFYPKTVKVM